MNKAHFFSFRRLSRRIRFYSSSNMEKMKSNISTIQSSAYAQTHTNAEVINFGIGQPSPSLLPMELFEKAAKHRFQSSQDIGILQYGAAKGFIGFRRELATFLSAEYGIKVHEDELMISAGNSQAISNLALVFGHSQNKPVFVEEPSYFLAFDIFKEQGLRVESLPMDQQGLQVDALEKKLFKGNIPSLVYTIPTFHNPTGTILSIERRKKLVQLAEEYGFYIISDEPYNLLNFENTARHTPLYTGRSKQIISLGSFSKILSPGLRLGWMHCHSETIQQIASSGVYRSGGGNNPVSAGIVHSILEQNLLRDHVKQLNKVLKERKIVLCNALRAYCCECSFEVPDEGGGYFVWIKLPSGFDSTKLLEISSKQGVAFTPGERCSLDGQMRNYCRFSFAFYTSEEIQEGIKRLGMILRSKINS